MEPEQRAQMWMLIGTPSEDAKILMSWLVSNDGYIRDDENNRIGIEAAEKRAASLRATMKRENLTELQVDDLLVRYMDQVPDQ